jgi:hypothetical protein
MASAHAFSRVSGAETKFSEKDGGIRCSFICEASEKGAELFRVDELPRL